MFTSMQGNEIDIQSATDLDLSSEYRLASFIFDDQKLKIKNPSTTQSLTPQEKTLLIPTKFQSDKKEETKSIKINSIKDDDGAFLVQVGAFRSKDGALLRQEAWNARIKDNSEINLIVIIKVYMIDSAPLYRVFVKGFDHKSAEDYLSKNKEDTLIKQGFYF